MEYVDLDKVRVSDQIQNGGKWYSVVAIADGPWKIALELREAETDPQTVIGEYAVHRGNAIKTQILVKRVTR